MSEIKKGRGRPRLYDVRDNYKGAPQVNIRLEPVLHEWVKAQPEGPRAYVTRLVTEDKERRDLVPTETAGDPAGSPS